MSTDQDRPDEANITAEALQELRAVISGRVVTPDDADYENSRLVWNGMIDRCPALVVECASSADVSNSISFARRFRLPLAVRGGGHSVAGLATCDGGLVVDLRPLNSVALDPVMRTVTVGGGANLGEMDDATQAHGLAVPGGVVSDTGVGGLTLSGGVGFLRRKHGLTIDNLLAADVVTAAGEEIHASEDENTDLFWALKGGGGNFGVVTKFQFRAHPIGPEVFHFFVFYPHEDGMTVLRKLNDEAEQMPDEMSIIAVTIRIPANDEFPRETWGRQSVALLGAYVGEPEEGQEAFAPWREIVQPLVDMSGIRPYVAMQKALDEDYPRHELRYYWKSQYMNSLPDEAIEKILLHAESAPSDLSTIDIWQLGGAINGRDPSATAFGDRSAPFLFNIESNWISAEYDQANLDWTRKTMSEMQPWLIDRAYLNFPGFLEEGEAQARAAFGDNYEKLREIKARYDPDNVFQLNTNIPPAA